MTTHDETSTAATIPAAGCLSGFTGGAIDIETIKDLTDRAGSEIDGMLFERPPEGIPHEIPAFIDRQSGSLKSVKSLLEEYRTHPARKTGTAVVNTLESFIDLTNRHKTGHSAIFADTNWKSHRLRPSSTTTTTKVVGRLTTASTASIIRSRCLKNGTPGLPWTASSSSRPILPSGSKIIFTS